jgi:hypothetical protein
MIARDYMLTNLEKDNSWKGGNLIVPFVGAGASSVSFGSLTSSTDVAEDAFVRGSITGPGTEVWGTMIFNHQDLMQADGKIPETTFLRLLPDRVEAFMRVMKEAVSVSLLVGGSFAKSVVDTDLANGIIEVDHIDRFQIGQKVSLDDDNSSPTDYYVIAINVNGATLSSGTGTVTLSATRGGAAASLTAYTTAQNAKFYHPGSQASSFVSLRSALLSSANGGSSTIHGQTKTAYPVLQAVNIDGSTITATNILDKLLDGYTEVRRRGKGNADTIVMSYKHLGSIMKLIEVQKGGFKVSVNSTKASMYGWTEIEVTSVRGNLKIVGVQEMDDDIIAYVDWSGLKFFSNGFFKKRMSPDGKEYFEVRNTTGYQYLVDICLFGELQVHAPGHMGILYGISY